MTDIETKIDNPYWDIVQPFARRPDWGWGRLAVQRWPDPGTYSRQGRDAYAIECARLPDREKLVMEYAWSIPDPQALGAFMDAQVGPMVEIGAGAGYWAWCIEQLGGEVVCYDENPAGDTTGETNMWHSGAVQWTPVLRAGIEAIDMHQDRALFLSWPPYAQPMAHEALLRYTGSTLVYIGEGEGGCTGDDGFHEELERNWERTHDISLVQWYGLHDVLEIYDRRPAPKKGAIR